MNDFEQKINRKTLIAFIVALLCHVAFVLYQVFRISQKYYQFPKMLPTYMMLISMTVCVIASKPLQYYRKKINDMHIYKEYPHIRFVGCIAICCSLLLYKYLMLHNLYKIGIWEMTFGRNSYGRIVYCLIVAVIEESFYKGTAVRILSTKTEIPMFFIVGLISLIYSLTWLPTSFLFIVYSFSFQALSILAFILYPSLIPIIIWNFLFNVLTVSGW